MGGSNKGCWTIGEVEQLTGISKREIKYCIEQGLIRPERKSASGYWLYGEREVERLRMAVLCRRLDIPNPAIRELLSSPTVRWRPALERQILRLREQRSRTETRLDTAMWLLEHLSEPECVETALLRYREGLLRDAVPVEK